MLIRPIHILLRPITARFRDIHDQQVTLLWGHSRKNRRPENNKGGTNVKLRQFAAGLLAAAALVTMQAPAATLAQEVTTPKVTLDDPLAAFLESRSLAQHLGATAEFNKMEGVAFDPVNKKLYIAMSSISGGMSDKLGSIQLPKNDCGAVYVADLDATWNITSLKPLVVGGPYNAANVESRCDINNIANPDNLFVDATGTLWIGEDTSNHPNDYLWAYDGKELKRFAAMPAGAEVTGLYITEQGTLFLNAQDPDAMNVYPFNRGTIGVVKGFTAGQNFKALPVPQGAETKKLMVAAGEYQVLGRAGDLIPGDLRGDRFGQRTNANGTAVYSNNPDGNMFLPTAERGDEGYLYTNFESRPGGVTKLYIRKGEKGAWEVIEGENVDFMPVGGTWNNCFASVTPWNTGLTSEEYEPAVDQDWQARVSDMTTYLGRQANPYDYGYNVELEPSGLSTRVTKRYAMGRFSHENALVMPDSKTVFETDDGGNVVLFKFVADKAGDLSAGTLYAAKVTQVTEGSDYRFDLEWVRLGSGNDKAIQAGIRALDAKITR